MAGASATTPDGKQGHQFHPGPKRDFMESDDVAANVIGNLASSLLQLALLDRSCR